MSDTQVREMPVLRHQEPSPFEAAREAAWHHTPFCGAHPQFILDEANVPVYVNGRQAAMWRASNPERMVIGETRWANGFEVQTRLDQYAGNFYTIISAGGLNISGDITTAGTAEAAMAKHKEAVLLVMQMADFHGHESSPSQDRQLVTV